MIELRTETLLSLSQAAAMLPKGRRGRPVTLSCVLRWITDGVRTPSGIVYLEALRLGGRWLTSLEALARFADAQTPRKDGDPAPVRRSPTARARAVAKAEQELSAIGI
jgi:hypothetical protein